MSPAAFARAVCPLPTNQNVDPNVSDAVAPELKDVEIRLQALKDLKDSRGQTIKQVIYVRTYTYEEGLGGLGAAAQSYQHWSLYNTQLPSMEEIRRRQREC